MMGKTFIVIVRDDRLLSHRGLYAWNFGSRRSRLPEVASRRCLLRSQGSNLVPPQRSLGVPPASGRKTSAGPLVTSGPPTSSQACCRHHKIIIAIRETTLDMASMRPSTRLSGGVPPTMTRKAARPGAPVAASPFDFFPDLPP